MAISDMFTFDSMADDAAKARRGAISDMMMSAGNPSSPLSPILKPPARTGLSELFKVR